MKSCYIYGLYDPRDPDLIMYVGKADDPQKRLKSHVAMAAGKTPKHNRRFHIWVRNVKPAVRVLEQVDEASWAAREVYWIAAVRRVNPKLFNITKGGQGSWEAGRTVAGFSGQRFGGITLDRLAGRSSNGSREWWCYCDCDRLCFCAGYDDIKKRTSCVLCKRERDAERMRQRAGNKSGVSKPPRVPTGGKSPEQLAAASARARARGLALPADERTFLAHERNAAKRKLGRPRPASLRDPATGKFIVMPHAD